MIWMQVEVRLRERLENAITCARCVLRLVLNLWSHDPLFLPGLQAVGRRWRERLSSRVDALSDVLASCDVLWAVATCARTWLASVHYEVCTLLGLASSVLVALLTYDYVRAAGLLCGWLGVTVLVGDAAAVQWAMQRHLQPFRLEGWLLR